ncbi:MAG: hypothetical protein ACKVQW_13535 [Pyrinomonadaceae bacterium]
MFSTKISLTVILLFVFPVVEFAQNNRLFKSVAGIVDLDYVQEEITGPIYLRFDDYEASAKPKIVLRLCTKDSIHLAVVKSALYFPSIISNFKKIGYSGDKLLILRSGGCKSKIDSVVTTEVWTIFSGDEFPSYEEKYTSDRIQVKVISRSVVKYTGSSDYKRSALELADELKKDKSKVGVVMGLYRRSSKRINQKLLDVRRLFKQNKIYNSRYILRSYKWRQELSPDALEKGDLSPAFYLVDINKDL